MVRKPSRKGIMSPSHTFAHSHLYTFTPILVDRPRSTLRPKLETRNHSLATLPPSANCTSVFPGGCQPCGHQKITTYDELGPHPPLFRQKRFRHTPLAAVPNRRRHCGSGACDDRGSTAPLIRQKELATPHPSSDPRGKERACPVSRTAPPERTFIPLACDQPGVLK